MTHPRDAGVGFNRPRRGARQEKRSTRGRRGERVVPLPELERPVHLVREMDCPRCLDTRRAGARGTVRVQFGLHVHLLDVEDEPTPVPALGISVAPLPREVGGPATLCSAGCALSAQEWETILTAAFLDLCEKYADVSKSLG